MYEAPRIQFVLAEAENLMNDVLGSVNSGNSGNNEWTENERSIDSLFDDLLQSR